MSWCSVSVSAAASASASVAIGNVSLVSTPSNWHHHLRLYPYKLNLPIELKINTVSTSSSSRPVISRNSVTGSDSIELNGEEEDTEAEQVFENEAARLYVGNLPFSMTSSQLSEIFAEAGRVLSVEIVYDKRTDRSRGFAFVTMGAAEEAKEAIRLFDGAQIGGRSAKVNFPEVPRGAEKEITTPKIRSSRQGFVDSPHKVYAGNLSWNLTSDSLREVFAGQPGFLSARVLYDRETGKSRGFGFITFTSAQDVELAISAMDGVELEGRPLRIKLAEERAPLSV